MQDIIRRKRKYEDLEMSFDDRLDSMFERQWTLGTWAIAIVASIAVVGALLVVGNLVIGLD